MDIAERAAESYARMYESLCEDQQKQKHFGNPLMAAKAGYFAPVVREARDAEIDDPEPPDAPYLHCIECLFYIRRNRA